MQSQPIDLPTQAWRFLVHTLIALLPPPIEDTPEATLTRNHAAIARVAALAPVNANEAELAAQCVAARAQAEDMLRLIRLHAADIALVIKLNAQYAAMIRASLSAHNRLTREQGQRRKREASNQAAEQDAATRRTTAEAMLSALHPASEPVAVAKTDTESHAPKTETPKIQLRPEPRPEPRPERSIEAMIDAALRTTNPNWTRYVLPSPSTAIERTIQRRSA